MSRMRQIVRELALLALLGFLIVTLLNQSSTIRAIKKDTMMTLTVMSGNFQYGERIPDSYTCTGADISPHLKWSPGPKETDCYVVICDDPDGPSKVWVHWVLFNLPAQITELNEHVSKEETLLNGASQGTNDMGQIGYNGACPPLGGGTHHYHFKVYALDCALKLEPGATKEEVEASMDGHILAQGEIIGTYSR